MGMPVIVPSTTTKTQVLNDMIESIALEQTALSHILNAEGEKIQAILSIPAVTSDQILEVNKSVHSMINSVARLEMILQSNLELFSSCISCKCTPSQ